MDKTKRGLKVAGMLLSLLTVGVVADSGNLFGQSHTTTNTPTYNQGAVVMDHGVGTTYNDGVVVEHGAGCTSCNAAQSPVVYHQPAPVYTAAAPSCGCSSCARGGCTSCLKKKKTCPSCDCPYCELEVKKGEVEKSSYKTEQKEVCIPAVRLPWKKNCPPKRSKVRTVNVLKKHKYKCPKCEYKWSVHEPEDFEPTPAKSSAASEPVKSSKPAATDSGKESVLQDPSEAWGDVPRPPLEDSKK